MTRQVSSVDRAGGNQDGSYLHAFTKYVDTHGEHVIFDERGPGCLYRQQMNIWTAVKTEGTTAVPDAGRCRIRYYFDDESNPRLDRTMDELFGGETPPFLPPLLFTDPMKRFADLYYPLAFLKRLKITVVPVGDWQHRLDTWQQFTYQTYATGEGVMSWKPAETPQPEPTLDAVREQWRSIGQDPKSRAGNATIRRTLSIAPGASENIQLDGQGSVASVKVHLEPYSRETFYDTSLRIYWDGQETPAVDVPLGYFFGSGGANYMLTAMDVPARSLRTLFFGYDGASHTMYSYWPMPYWGKARFEFVNRSQTPITALTCEIEVKSSAIQPYPQKQCGYFYAKRTVDDQNQTKPYAEAFTAKGRGRVVGLSFYSDGYDMDGDEFTYIDGNRSPQIHGDGTEDDHGQGWGGSNFQEPLWGALLNGYQGAYRIYYGDAYAFNHDITIRYEYSKENYTPSGNPKTDVTIFYYLSPEAKSLQLTDELDVGNSASEKAHRYLVTGTHSLTTINSSYDGYAKRIENDPLTDSGYHFNGRSEFQVSINPANMGVRLRKRTDRRGSSPQTAEVWVDGKPISERPWQLVYPSSVTEQQAWDDADFEIPAQYTRGKANLTIQMRSSNWNEFYYSVYCYPADE